MNLFFVPRQPEDPRGEVIGMYYTKEMDRMDLCDIENMLLAGEAVIIVRAPAIVVQRLREALLPLKA